MLLFEEITHGVVGSAIEVHRVLGPGLLESAYEEALSHEFTLRKLPYQRQVPLVWEYKGVVLQCGYRLDFLVAGTVVIELKCVESILPVHQAQLLTYLKVGQKRVGLLIKFNVEILKDGIIRRII